MLGIGHGFCVMDGAGCSPSPEERTTERMRALFIKVWALADRGSAVTFQCHIAEEHLNLDTHTRACEGGPRQGCLAISAGRTKAMQSHLNIQPLEASLIAAANRRRSEYWLSLTSASPSGLRTGLQGSMVHFQMVQCWTILGGSSVDMRLSIGIGPQPMQVVKEPL